MIPKKTQTILLIGLSVGLHASLFLFGIKKTRFLEVSVDMQNIYTQIGMVSSLQTNHNTQTAELTKEMSKSQKPELNSIKVKSITKNGIALRKQEPKNISKIPDQLNVETQAKSSGNFGQNNSSGGSENAGESSAMASHVGASKKVISRYIMTIRNQVERKKFYPAIAKANQEEGLVVLKLKLSKAGRLLAHEIDQKNQYQRLNEAAQASLLKAATSFPPFPVEMEGMTELIFTIPLNFSIRFKS